MNHTLIYSQCLPANPEFFIHFAGNYDYCIPPALNVVLSESERKKILRLMSLHIMIRRKTNSITNHKFIMNDEQHSI
jgi:hypothetical protein